MTEPVSPRPEWRLLGRSLLARTVSPIRQPTYIFYFLVCMLAGATGIWAAMTEAWLTLREGSPIRTIVVGEGTFKATVTFFVALGSASCAKIVMTEDKEKHLRGLFTLLLFVFAVIAAVAFVVGYRAPTDGMLLAGIGTVLAIFAWWIANWDRKAYNQPEKTPALGGSPGKDAAGDTIGFKV